MDMSTIFQDILKNINTDIQRYYPYHSISDRAFWEHLPKDIKSQLSGDADALLHQPVPAIPATLYMDFYRTGTRTHFEDAYFLRRNRLNLLILAECIQNKGRYLDDIIDYIWAICEESVWHLPPHNSYVRYGGIMILPDTSQPILDLFSCETGALLATAFYMMQPAFDGISPFISKRIATELNNRIITPYFKSNFWWMGSDEGPVSNWTIWCTQNILLSYFLMEPYWNQNINQKDSRQLLKQVCTSTDYFLDGYGEDGCCEEGAQYYRHAALCLLNTLEILNFVTDNAFMGAYETDKIRNMASYIFHMHVDDKYYVNFADSSPVAGRAGTREYIFGKRTNQPELMRFAALDFKRDEGRLLHNEINLFYRLQMLHYYREMMAYDTTAPAVHKDIYYPSVGVFIARDTHRFLAVKAGHNNDSHNHNDTGSFTVYKDGRPVFIDVGVETYTAKTFSDERYSLWVMQSAYHNLPTLNGFMEHEFDYAARDVSYSFDTDSKSISMDLGGTFVTEAGIKTCIRSATLVTDKEIVIKDCYTPEPKQQISPGVTRFNTLLDLTRDSEDFDGVRAAHAFIPDFVRTVDSQLIETWGKIQNGGFLLTYMTYERPHIDETQHGLIHIGDLATLQLEGDFAITIEEIPITDQRLQSAWEHDIYRILVFAESSEIVSHIV